MIRWRNKFEAVACSLFRVFIKHHKFSKNFRSGLFCEICCFTFALAFRCTPALKLCCVKAKTKTKTRDTSIYSGLACAWHYFGECTLKLPRDLEGLKL